jgi:hypothetical protein
VVNLIIIGFAVENEGGARGARSTSGLNEAVQAKRLMGGDFERLCCDIDKNRKMESSP